MEVEGRCRALWGEGGKGSEEVATAERPSAIPDTGLVARSVDCRLLGGCQSGIRWTDEPGM